jgi:hypothetical protein
VIDATLMSGADMGMQIMAALAQAYATAGNATDGIGGATVDARGFLCPTQCVIGTQDLVVGSGSFNGFSGQSNVVKLLLPIGNIKLNTIASTGLSAKILFKSNVNIEGQGDGVTIIQGGADGVTVGPAPGTNPSTVHLSKFSISDAGTVTPGSAALGLSGLAGFSPLLVPAGTRTTNGFGNGLIYMSSWWTGRVAHYAIYPTALTATQIANHYAASSNIST